MSPEPPPPRLPEGPPPLWLPGRMGCHFGEVVIWENGDLFGHEVNVAARLEPQAAVGTVCVSDEVFPPRARRVHACVCVCCAQVADGVLGGLRANGVVAGQLEAAPTVVSLAPPLCFDVRDAAYVATALRNVVSSMPSA